MSEKQPVLSLRHHTPAPALALALGLATLMVGACTSSPMVQQAAMPASGAEAGDKAPLLSLARRLADEGRHAAAIPLYRQVISGGAMRPQGLVGLGQSLIAMGQIAEAEKTFLLAVRADKNLAAAYLGLGEVDLAFGRSELALKQFDQAIATAGPIPLPEAHSGRAVALDALGRHDEALKAHDRALQSGGDDLNLRSNLALSHALYDENEKAIALLEDIVKSPKAKAQHRQNLVLAYVFANRMEPAGQMARVDLDHRSALETLAYFRELESLPPAQRVAALILGLQSPARTPSDQAILVFEETEDKSRAAARLVTAPEPEPAPEPAPAPQPEPEPKPEPEPEPAPEPVDLPPLIEPEGWSVQVAAYRTADQLIKGQKYYWDHYQIILEPLEPRRSEVDFGDRNTAPRGFFYRLNAGPLRDLEQARDVCAALKKAGAPCWIRPPEPPEGRLPDEAAQQDEAEK
ncbi:hypothetical protein JCM17846_00040 [Iodidimonas nitroreducens]|uniref:SPOR domain-containing protein n=1 Tax=Iodidimonas nitroreducens TaxID=1236968 RepID=A0A5A7N206_9PROT|nr:SPOR domain-containing protein [Iodidimonas nitroreducens]GAK34926.1 type III secretion low calcium response chaperone LcrH/SycD [alpha proteobacterium Q-1]GER02322.1 hypothetical protein JCM17846_00040 [Iodidimonas nitroreducens]